MVVFEHFMSQMQHGHKLFNRKIAFLVRGKSCEIVQNICVLWVKLNTCLLVCGRRVGHELLNRTKHMCFVGRSPMLEKHAAVRFRAPRAMDIGENILCFEQSVFFSSSTFIDGEAVFWYISARGW